LYIKTAFLVVSLSWTYSFISLCKIGIKAANDLPSPELAYIKDPSIVFKRGGIDHDYIHLGYSKPFETSIFVSSGVKPSISIQLLYSFFSNSLKTCLDVFLKFYLDTIYTYLFIFKYMINQKTKYRI